MSLNFEAFSDYPNVSGKYGIDFKSLASTSNKDGWYTQSGRKVFGYIRSDLITLVDEDPRLFPNWKGKKLYANYFEDNEAVEFDLETKVPFPFRRHVDFYATQFVESSIKFFESNSGKVTRWESEFVPGSDTYRQYTYLLSQNLTPAEAVRLTWYGQLATKLGFSLLDDQPQREDMNGQPRFTCEFVRDKPYSR